MPEGILGLVLALAVLVIGRLGQDRRARLSGALDGFFGFTAISKGNEDRIELILRVANYLAAPFGTKEGVANGYGREGEHFTVGAKGPVLTDKAKAEREFSSRYLCAGPDTIFIPAVPDLARTRHQFQSDHVPTLLRNAASGLFSDTFPRARRSSARSPSTAPTTSSPDASR